MKCGSHLDISKSRTLNAMVRVLRPKSRLILLFWVDVDVVAFVFVSFDEVDAKVIQPVKAESTLQGVDD